MCPLDLLVAVPVIASSEKKETQKFIIGDKVQAKTNGKWNNSVAKVIAVNRDGTYDVRFDGGSEESGLKASWVRSPKEEEEEEEGEGEEEEDEGEKDEEKEEEEDEDDEEMLPCIELLPYVDAVPQLVVTIGGSGSSGERVERMHSSSSEAAEPEKSGEEAIPFSRQSSFSQGGVAPMEMTSSPDMISSPIASSAFAPFDRGEDMTHAGGGVEKTADSTTPPASTPVDKSIGG